MAQHIANYESPRAKLYDLPDRKAGEVSPVVVDDRRQREYETH